MKDAKRIVFGLAVSTIACTCNSLAFPQPEEERQSPELLATHITPFHLNETSTRPYEQASESNPDKGQTMENNELLDSSSKDKKGDLLLDPPEGGKTHPPNDQGVSDDKDNSDEAQSTSASFLVGALVAVAIAAVAGGGGYAWYRHMHYLPGTPKRIAETSVAYAARNLENLFKSAQQTFIHRNGKRMGASIEELGEHFSIGSNGTIIYREIWYARYGRPESDITPVPQQDDWERNALADPYRYAVLPVRNLESPELDDRTSVLVAIPVSPTDIPGLLVVAGPVRNDPADFLRKWPIKRIVTPEGCSLLRERIDSEKPFDKTFAEEISVHFEEL